MATTREILELLIQVTGAKDVAGLRTEIERLGGEGEDSAKEMGELVDELEALQQAERAAKSIAGVKASLADTRAQLEQASAGLIALNKQFSFADRSSAAVSKAFRTATKAVEDLTARERQQELQLQRMQGALAKAGADANKLGDAERLLATQTEKVSAKVTQLVDKLRGTQQAGAAAAEGVKRLGNEAQSSTSKLGGVENALTKIVSVAAAVTAALKAIQFGQDALKGSADLELALSQVQAVASAGAEELRELRTAAQAAAADTGIVADEIVGGLGELARTGLSAKESIAALRPTLDLAQGGVVGLTEAVSIATTTLTQFGLGAEQTTRVADVLSKGANASDASVQGLGLSLSYAAPLARQLGLDLEQTVGIVAALAKEGFRGERAGTALRNVFSALLDPSSKFREELERLNIRGNDLGEILRQLAARGEDGKRALLALDSEARPAILSLFSKGGDSIRFFTDLLREADGEAARTAATVRDNLSTSFERLKATFDNTLANLIEPVLKPLQVELQALATQIQNFANSPDFAKLQAGLGDTLRDGIAAAREFIASVDFQAVQTNLVEFTHSVRDLIFLVRQLADESTLVGRLSEWADQLNVVTRGTGLLGDALRAERLAAEAAATATERATAAAAQMDAAQTAAVAGAQQLAAAEQQVGTAATTAATDTEVAAVRIGSAFAAVVTDANATSEAIRAAFEANLDASETVEQVERLGEDIRVAFEAGKISAEEFAAAEARVRDRTAELTETIDNLARRAAQAYAELQAAIEMGAAPEVIELLRERFDSLNASIKAAETGQRGLNAALAQGASNALSVEQAMRNLGITSQRELERTRDSARQAFDTIVQGARNGEAATADVRRAFVAYAQAALAAARDLDVSARAQVESQLRAQGATLGLRDALVELGLVGEQAGQRVAAGANQATAALRGTEAAARGAAAASTSVASANTQSAQSFVAVAASADQASFAIEGVSEKFRQLAEAQTGRLRRTSRSRGESDLFTDLQEQNRLLDEEIARARERNAAFDETEQRIAQLRGQYELLSDDRLRQLAQEQLRFEENQRRQQELVDRQRESQRQAAEQERAARQADASRDTGGRTGGSSGSLTINFNPTIYGAIDRPTADRWVRPLRDALRDLERRRG